MLRNRTHGKLERQLKLFVHKRALEYMCIDILGPLLTTKTGSQFGVVMTDHYTKPAEAVLSTKKATTVAQIFIEYYLARYNIPSRFLAIKCSQFLPKLFLEVCSTLRINNITTTKFSLQTKDQAKHFDLTVIFRLCQYVSSSRKIRTYTCYCYCTPITYKSTGPSRCLPSLRVSEQPQDLPRSYQVAAA